MGARLDPTIGFGLFESRNNPDTLADVGVGANDSAYTEAGPIPGHPEPTDPASRWRPMIRGAQSVSLHARTIRGSYPGRTGASVAYRLATDTDAEDYRGWSSYNLPVNWTAPSGGWGSAKTWDYVAGAVITSTGVLVITACDDSASEATSFSYNPRTGVWAELYDWDAGAKDGLRGPIGMAYDEPRDRLILWSGAGTAGSPDQIAYYSDDGGTTWALYSRGFWDSSISTFANGLVRVATATDGDWLAIVTDNDDGTGVSKQFASSDNGVTWELIGDTSLDGTQHTPLRTPNGFVVVYGAPTTGRPAARILASARSPFDDAAQVELDTTAVANIWGVVDPAGSIIVYTIGTNADTARDRVTMWESVNGGSTWTEYTWGAIRGNNATYPIWNVALASCGQVHLVGTQDGHADTDGTFSLLSLGGWGQVEAGSGDTNFVATHAERMGFGFYSATALVEAGGCYVPWDLPQNSGWTRTTGTGTQSLTGSEAALELTTTAGQGEVYGRLVTTAEASFIAGEIVFKAAASGNANLAAVGGTATGPFYALTLGDSGGYRYNAVFDLCSDGIQVRDVSTIRATLSLDTTADWVHLRVILRKGGVTAWYRVGEGTTWTRWANDVTITDTAPTSAQDQCGWGCNILSVGHLYIRLVGFADGGDWLYGVDGITDLDRNSANGVPGLRFGRPVPGRGGAFPLPDATATSEDVGAITAVGGPTYLSETVSLPADHTYDLDHIYPALSPSPRVQWRSTSTALTHITWDQGSGKQAWFGGALALAFLNAQPRTAVLEIDDNAGGWTTLGTLDKGWGSINYTLTGTSLVPRASTATIDRYIHEGELVGGYVICSTGGTSVARRIIRNSGGYWSTSSTLQQVRIDLDPTEVDGTETASGTGEIVHHSGVMVVYRTTDPPRRRLRIRIAASQITPGGYYAAGIAAIARVVGVGNAPAWGWTNRTDFSRTVRRAADGTPIVRENGPPRRIWSRGWPDGVQLQTMRLLASDAPRIEVSTFAPIGTKDDAWTAPVAWLEHALDSGEQPALMFPQLPTTSGTTITDPTGYLYGSLESDGVGMTAFAGKPGTDEVVRVDSISFEEIR